MSVDTPAGPLFLLLGCQYQADSGGSGCIRALRCHLWELYCKPSPAGKLQSYMLQMIPGGQTEKGREWEKMVKLEKCLSSNHEDLSLDPQHPSKVRPGGTCLSP